MKAAVFTKYGPPSIIQIKEKERPVPNNNEILVKVMATTVNRTDCAIIRAKPFIMRFVMGLFKPRKTIPGTDFAGIVEDVGKDVQLFQPGKRVFGFDDNGVCSQAEYLTIPENKAVAQIPDNIGFEEAAASIEGAHYTINFLNKIQLNDKDKVLVNGATGAIGSAMVQILASYGVAITAVGNTNNLELLKKLGAEKVIDYQKEDFTKQDEKYRFVFDAVGKSSFSECKPILEQDGIYISSELGFMAQNLFYSVFKFLTGNKKVVFPYPSKIHESVQLVKTLMEQGKFNPVIDRKYRLNDIVQAYEYVEKGEKTGNVVLTIN